MARDWNLRPTKDALVGHGFGVSKGTSAEGWIGKATRFFGKDTWRTGDEHDTLELSIRSSHGAMADCHLNFISQRSDLMTTQFRVSRFILAAALSAGRRRRGARSRLPEPDRIRF